MEPTTAPPEREERFREVYGSVYVDLLRFVRRRVHPTHAEDVVNDVGRDLPQPPGGARPG